MMLNSIRDAVMQLLPAKRKTNAASGWISFNAVCCHHRGESQDRRSRGGLVINTDGGISYHCFNCGFKAGYTPGWHLPYKFRKLLSWLGADEGTVRRLVIDAIRIKELVGPATESTKEPEQEICFSARPLPEEARTFWSTAAFYESNDQQLVPAEFSEAVHYIINRRVDVNTYDFYWTPEKSYNLHQRVIVPFTWKEQIVGYTARAINDTVRPKYYTSIDPGYVFNIDHQLSDSKFVVVVEGPFDAMSIDGVALLHNEVNEQQAEIIDRLGRQVIVVPDADYSGRLLVDAALEYGWDVSFPTWHKDYKDISQAVEKLGKLYVLRSILAAVETNKLKIELRKKKL